MRLYSLIFFITLQIQARELFTFPLVESSSLRSYAKKISVKRNKYQTLRRIDQFRAQSKLMKDIFNNRPHEKVIQSINSVDAPQVSTVAIAREEVIPFYSNFFREKIFIQKQMEKSWKDRAFQRILQFRHQNELGNSQIGGL